MAIPPSSTSLGVIWTTISVHGNTICLYEADWAHAISRHPEMQGREETIRRAVEKPRAVRQGLYPDSCAFEISSSTNAEGVRVLVQHDTEMYLAGGVTGWVTTSYPIETRKFKSRVGPIIGTYPENDGDDQL